MKKVLASILVLMMVLSIVPVSMAMDTDKTLENLNLTIVYFSGEEQYAAEREENPAAYDGPLEAKKIFEERFGGTVTFITTTWDEQLQTCVNMQSAGEAPDLVLLYENVFHGAVINGIVQPLDDYVQDSDFEFYALDKENYMWKNSVYAIPHKPYLKHIVFNRNMFDMAGLESPDEYFARGEWNFETFMELGRQLTVDNDGDGDNDVWGFSGLGDTSGQFFVANHGTFVNIDQANGVATSGLKNPETLEAISLMTDMWNNETGMWVRTTDTAGDFDRGTLAMCVGKEMASTVLLPFDCGMVPYPYGPSGSADEVYVYSQCWGVPTGAKNVEGAVEFIRLINELQSTVGADMEREQYGKGPDGVDMYDLIYADRKLITKYDKGFGNYWNIAATIENMMSDGTPAPSIAERIDPVLTAELAKVFPAAE